MSCDAKIRPFPGDTGLACSRGAHGDDRHEGVIRNAAYPGSETRITWYESDRRNYHGEWPGACEPLVGCVLPNGHAGRCVR